MLPGIHRLHPSPVRSHEDCPLPRLSQFSLCHRLSRSCAVLLLILSEVFLVHPSAAADRRATQSPDDSGGSIQTASVTLDGQVLFKVRGVTAFPAELRAGAIRDRLEAIASNHALTLDRLRVEEMPDRSIIKLSDEMVVTLFDVDADIGRHPAPALGRNVSEPHQGGGRRSIGMTGARASWVFTVSTRWEPLHRSPWWYGSLSGHSDDWTGLRNNGTGRDWRTYGLKPFGWWRASVYGKECGRRNG